MVHPPQVRAAKTASPQGKNPFFAYHSTLLLSLCVVDIVLNSSIEFADVPGLDAATANNTTVIVIVQVLLQIFGFVNLFAMLGATFLFRSGLFDMLYRQFRPVLWIHPGYISLTVVLGAIRVIKLGAGATLLEVWDSNGYAFLSGLQKIGAVCFYFSCIDAMEKLRDPKFYDQDYWLHR